MMLSEYEPENQGFILQISYESTLQSIFLFQSYRHRIDPNFLIVKKKIET